MEQNENSFIIDVLNILPEKTECFIQAPSLENSAIKEMLQKSDFDYFDLLILDENSKGIFIRQEFEASFSMYLQKIEIRENGILLFEGFDGCEYGIISKKVIIPEWFKEKYVPEICMVANEW
jgi:hypothetical protein